MSLLTYKKNPGTTLIYFFGDGDAAGGGKEAGLKSCGEFDCKGLECAIYLVGWRWKALLFFDEKWPYFDLLW